jgi:CheY-like chemotaxis protein
VGGICPLPQHTMSIQKSFSGSVVPRHLVYILTDGTFVVQWEENRVQELIGGKYRPYQVEDVGHVITDFELNQLKAAGRVEHFNKYYVWLYMLPEQQRINLLKVTDKRVDFVRKYYLNTMYPASELRHIQNLLIELGISNDYFARSRDGHVILLAKNGQPFRRLNDAEKGQHILQSLKKEFFKNLIISFVETPEDQTEAFHPKDEVTSDAEFTTSTAQHTPQDTAMTRGKRVVLAMGEDYEREAFQVQLNTMEMEVLNANSGEQALMLVEDYQPDLLLMDVKLPDMHAWRLLQKMSEITNLQRPAIIAIGDHTTSVEEQTFALTVANVNALLVKPLSMTRLKQQIWKLLTTSPSIE